MWRTVHPPSHRLSRQQSTVLLPHLHRGTAPDQAPSSSGRKSYSPHGRGYSKVSVPLLAADGPSRICSRVPLSRTGGPLLLLTGPAVPQEVGWKLQLSEMDLHLCHSTWRVLRTWHDTLCLCSVRLDALASFQHTCHTVVRALPFLVIQTRLLQPFVSQFVYHPAHLTAHLLRSIGPSVLHPWSRYFSSAFLEIIVCVCHLSLFS